MDDGHKSGNKFSTDLLRLYDDFVDCHDRYRFLMAAFVSLAQSEQPLDADAAEGLARFADGMTSQMSDLQSRLRRIKDSSFAARKG